MIHAAAVGWGVVKNEEGAVSELSGAALGTQRSQNRKDVLFASLSSLDGR